MATLTPPGYRSATEYYLDEAQTDAIVRTSAYQRIDYPMSVIWFSPHEHMGIRPSIATPFQRTSNIGIGCLDQLSLELLFDILTRLDMHSLFKFRQINLRSRQMVDSLGEYQSVASHGLNLFCALLRTRLAGDVSLLDFYDALCTKECTFCGEFGGFVSLIVWKRCCFECIQKSRETQMQTLAAIRKRCNITKAQLNQIRSFKSLPGVYSMKESTQNFRITLISLHQTGLVCRQQPIPLPQDQPMASYRTRKLNSMGSCALPYYDKQTGRVEHGISCAGCHLALDKGIIGTSDTDWGYKARDKVYSLYGFLDHFRWCEQAHLLWRSSDEGKNRPPELPVAAQRGGYLQIRE
jgi:hypothetical protein